MARRPGRPKRITRTWNAGIDPQIQQILTAQRALALKPITKLTRPATIPQSAYTVKQRTLLTGGYGATYVTAGGTALVQIGPQGVGTIWYPAQWAVATTSGAADNSTCTIYHGPQGLQTQTAGQSYSAGGDSGGLSVPPMFPGYFLLAVWSGGVPGDLATLTVYGQMDALVTG